MYVAQVDGKDVKLLPEKYITISFNHTLENEHHSIIIDVITEDYLDNYISMLVKEDEQIFDQIEAIYDKRKL
ncbi:MAG: hypothetical protein U5K00_21250 [Melioribacteraceae bacterium]|nr:hypothetical protein [Melioribacteraceae bacterium]